MASIILGAAGTVGGFMIGGPVGAAFGGAIGSALGGFIDGQIFNKSSNITLPGLTDGYVSGSSYGSPIPVVYGVDRVAGEMIYASILHEADVVTQASGGGGGKGGAFGGGKGATVTTPTYSINLAVGICKGPIQDLVRIWAGGLVLYDIRNSNIPAGNIPVTSWAWYPGSETQMPDPTLESIFGVGNVPAFRGLAYIVFLNLQLATWNNSVPNFAFEVVANINQSYTPHIITSDPFEGILQVPPLPLKQVPQLVTLDYIVQDICESCGLSSGQIDVSGIATPPVYVPGYQMTGQIDGRGGLAPLQMAYFFDGIESDGKLKFEFQDGVSVGAIAETDLGAREDKIDSNVDKIKTTRLQSIDLPQTLILRYPLSLIDYQVATAQAKRPANVVYSRKFTTMDVPIVMAPTDAAAAAERGLSLAYQGRSQVQFTTPLNYIQYEPGDTVTVTYGNGTITLPVYLQQVTIGANGIIEFTGVSTSAPAYTTVNPGAGPGGAPQNGVTPAITNIALIFEPPYEIADNGYEVWIIGAPSPGSLNWSGAQVWISLDGTNYQNVGSITSAATFGRTNADIPALTNINSNGSPVEDPALTLDISVTASGGTLNGTDRTSAQNGADYIIIGNELMTYVTADLYATTSYHLTDIFRNWWGTGGVDIPLGSLFVRLDGAQFQYPYNPALIGTTIYIKFVAYVFISGMVATVAETDPITYTLQGPPSPLPPDWNDPTLDATGIHYSWTRSAAANVHHYQIQTSSSDNVGVLGTTTGSSFDEGLQPLGTYNRYLFAVDDGGHFSVPPQHILINVLAAPAPVVTVSYAFGNATLSWNDVEGSFPTEGYEIRTGAGWLSGTTVGNISGLALTLPVTWPNGTMFWIAAVDAAGNYGTAGSVTSSITAPSAPVVSTSVFQTFVQFYITAVPGTLPTAYFSLWRGSIFASAAIEQPAITGTFTIFQEVTSGTYTYWITATDTAGNTGPPIQVQATVTNAPNFTILKQWVSTFNASSSVLTNCVLENGALTLPVNTTETFAQHFTNNSQTTMAGFVSAGYAYYAQPTPSTASYKEVFDYGTSLPATLITVSLNQTYITGAVMTLTPLIEISSDNVTYTSLGNVYQAFTGASFRYVRITISASAGDGKSLMTLSNLQVLLSLTAVSDSGSVSAVSTDSGGTLVTFAKTFVDITSLTTTLVTGGAGVYIETTNVLGVPNPTTFKVLVYDNTGTRQNGTVMWHADGN